MTNGSGGFVPGADDRPIWNGDPKALDGWNVFWATLRDGSIHSTLELGDSPGSDPAEAERAERAFRERVADRLTNWLQRNPQEAHCEAFRVLVATAPSKPNQIRIGLNARPTPEGCELVPSVELVQRVLREVFGVSDPSSPPTQAAVYVVDLLQPAPADRYQLFGPATSSHDDRIRALREILDAVMRRTSADFPIEVGHRLQASFLSNGKVLVGFPHRREPISTEVLDALPDLWSTAVEDPIEP
jgi:hypothetical protein